jgi:hypothetical protein
VRDSYRKQRGCPRFHPFDYPLHLGRKIVPNALDNLDDLGTFVSQVSAWIIAQREDD